MKKVTQFDFGTIKLADKQEDNPLMLVLELRLDPHRCNPGDCVGGVEGVFNGNATVDWIDEAFANIQIALKKPIRNAEGFMASKAQALDEALSHGQRNFVPQLETTEVILCHL